MMKLQRSFSLTFFSSLQFMEFFTSIYSLTEPLPLFLGKKLLLLTLPISVFLFLFSPVVVKLFFGYGAFSRMDVELTATALRFYALSLPFMFFWPLIYRVFQIRGRLLSVGVVGVIGVVANAIFNYLFVFVFNLGIAGICLGTFLAYVFICTLGYFMLRYYDKRAWR